MNIDLYRDLFVHRSDVFAQQHKDGSYRPVKRPLDDMDIEEHLGGMASYGVYVIDPEPSGATREPSGEPFYGPNTVSYVVFDLDTYDPAALKFLCQAVYELVVRTDDVTFGSPWAHCECCLLESSGGKGYHIWLFLSEPVPAERVRYWTEPVRQAYTEKNPWGAWPELEIFPKQDTVPEGGYGNLVKLPFGVHAKSRKRSEIVVVAGWAKSVDNVVRLDASLIPDVPEEAKRKQHTEAGRVAPFACISKLITEGIGKGARDKAMFHFCHYAFGTGMPEDIVHEWAERVNDNFDPPLTDYEVEKCVHSAAGMSSPHPGCGADWLKGFCPGGASCFAPWNDEKPGKRKERVEHMSEDLTREKWLARRRARHE